MGVIRGLLTPAFIAALAGGIVFLTPLGFALEQEVGLSWLFKLRGSVAAPASVVVVDIDTQSTIQLEQPSKLRLWKRSLHAELIRNLVQRGAAVIVFDIFFEETGSPDGDQEFAAEIRRSGRVALVQQVQREQVGNLIFDKLIFPATKLSAAAQGLAPFPLPKVRNRYGQFWAFYSDVSHSSTLPVVALQLYVLQSYGYENFLALLQASGYQNINQLPAIVADSNDLQQLMQTMRQQLRADQELFDRLQDSVKQVNAGDPTSAIPIRQALSALINTYRGSEAYDLNFYGPGRTISTIPYATILQQAVNGDTDEAIDVAGKVVFVGGSGNTQDAQDDSFFTVFSGADGVDILGVEMAATAFSNLVENRTLRAPSILANLVIVLVFGSLAGFLAYRSHGVLALPATAAVTAVYLAVCYYLFVDHHIWIPVIIPLAIQLPLAVASAYLSQYQLARAAREQYGRTIRHYVPERVALEFDAGRAPSTTPELVYGTCMSTDVSNYTSLSERIPAAELAALNSEYFGLLGACVTGQQGEMLEVRGDGMNSVWSASEQDPRLNQGACLAACEILQAVDRFNSDNTERQMPTRIGLHAGRVALGNVGGGGHLAFSVVGDSINTASRIQELNKRLHTRLLASETVTHNLEGWLTRRVCLFRAKGKETGLQIHEIFGPDAHVSGDSHRLCGLFTAAMRDLEAAQWSRAADMFTAILLIYPNDGPSMFYLDRCRTYLVSPPPVGQQSTIDDRELQNGLN